MKKLFLLIVAAAMVYWAYTRYYLNPTLSGVLRFPKTIAWREVDASPKKSETQNPMLDMVVAADDDRWREEIGRTNRQVLVAVFDGQRFATTTFAGVTAPTAEALDPVRPLRQLYDSLPKSTFEGNDEMDGRPCWRFKATVDDMEQEVWIDRETRFPVRVTGKMPDGSALDQRYTVVQMDIERGRERIFDVRTLVPLFTDYLFAK